MRSKSQTAWEAAARWAALAEEADDFEEREYYARLHDREIDWGTRVDSPAMNSCAICRLNSMLWERCLAMAFIP